MSGRGIESGQFSPPLPPRGQQRFGDGPRGGKGRSDWRDISISNANKVLRERQPRVIRVASSQLEPVSPIADVPVANKHEYGPSSFFEAINTTGRLPQIPREVGHRPTLVDLSNGLERQTARARLATRELNTEVKAAGVIAASQVGHSARETAEAIRQTPRNLQVQIQKLLENASSFFEGTRQKVQEVYDSIGTQETRAKMKSVLGNALESIRDENSGALPVGEILKYLDEHPSIVKDLASFTGQTTSQVIRNLRLNARWLNIQLQMMRDGWDRKPLWQKAGLVGSLVFAEVELVACGGVFAAPQNSRLSPTASPTREKTATPVPLGETENKAVMNRVNDWGTIGGQITATVLKNNKGDAIEVDYFVNGQMAERVTRIQQDGYYVSIVEVKMEDGTWAVVRRTRDSDTQSEFRLDAVDVQSGIMALAKPAAYVAPTATGVPLVQAPNGNGNNGDNPDLEKKDLRTAQAQSKLSRIATAGVQEKPTSPTIDSGKATETPTDARINPDRFTPQGYVFEDNSGKKIGIIGAQWSQSEIDALTRRKSFLQSIDKDLLRLMHNYDYFGKGQVNNLMRWEFAGDCLGITCTGKTLNNKFIFIIPDAGKFLLPRSADNPNGWGFTEQQMNELFVQSAWHEIGWELAYSNSQTSNLFQGVTGSIKPDGMPNISQQGVKNPNSWQLGGVLGWLGVEKFRKAMNLPLNDPDISNLKNGQTQYLGLPNGIDLSRYAQDPGILTLGVAW